MAHKTDATYWNIYINGVNLLGTRRDCITSFSIDELCDGSDTLTVSISDPNFEFIEDNIFLEDASVRLELGLYESTYRKVFNGYISAIDINFPNDGVPVITLTCLDNSHLMNTVKNEQTWENVTRADVVREIATKYGFAVDIDGDYQFSTQESISQSKQTDIEFLESLAGDEREPFMCKLADNTIIYKKKGLLNTPVITLGYKTFPFDVVSFSPQINKETHKEKVSDGNVDDNKNVETFDATDDTVQRDVQGSAVQVFSGMVYDPEKRQWSEIEQ